MPKNYEDVKIITIDYSPKEYQEGWQDKELITHIFGVNTSGESVHLQIKDTRPRIWTKQNPDDLDIEPEMRRHITEIKFDECITYSNSPEPLYTIYLDYPFMVSSSAYRNRGIRGYFDWHGQADIPYRDAVRWFYGWKDVIRIPRGKRVLSASEVSPIGENVQISTNDVMLDIECVNKDGSFADAKYPTGTIYCWSLKNLKTGEIVHATIVPVDKEEVKKCLRSGTFLYQNCTINKKKFKETEIKPITDNISILQFDTERELLLALKKVLDVWQINIIEGFNVKDFDISYIRNRINKMNRVVSRRRKKGSNDEYYSVIEFIKMMPFDLMEGYRKYRHKSSLGVEDKRIGLDWLGKETLGYGKIKRPEMLEMIENNPVLLSVYNIWDVELPSRIEEKLGVLDHYKGYCARHGCSLEHYGSMIFLAESKIIHEVKCKEIFPSRKFVPKVFMEKHGAYVDDAITGVYYKMVELDLSGQYPGAILTGNLDIKTRLILDIMHTENYFGKKVPFIKFPSGRMYRTDIEGTIPKMIRELKAERNEIRRKMKELDNDRDNPLYQKYKKDQEIVKHSMAAWSGGFGTAHGKTDFISRFADNGCYNDITEISRLLKKWNKKEIESYECIYNPKTKDIKCYRHDNNKDGFFNTLWLNISLNVRYGDTDSTKCTINNMEELEEKMGREFNKEDLEIIGEHYAEMLNDSYKDFSKQYLGTEKHYFNVKAEDPIKAYFQWGKKKLYVELDFDNERHDKGAATVRSDRGLLMKDVMDYIIDRIIFNEQDKLSEYLAKIEKKVKSGEYTTELGTPQRIKTQTNDWYYNMMYSNELFGYKFKLGDKPVFYYLKKLHGKVLPKNKVVAFKIGDDPVKMGAVIDYEKHLELIKQGLSSIFEGLGTKWDSIRDGFKKRSLEGFF